MPNGAYLLNKADHATASSQTNKQKEAPPPIHEKTERNTRVLWFSKKKRELCTTDVSSRAL